MLLGFDFDRLSLFNNQNQTFKMVQSVEGVEEGEIPDSASVEEISNQKESLSNNSKAGSVLSNEATGEKPRIWTMQDLYKYQLSRNYASGLYNLAWAQAVQNKPLAEVYNCNNTSSSNNNNNILNDENSSVSKKDDSEADNDHGVNELVKDKVVIDLSSGDDDDNGEKEEGELEEGEIDFNVSDLDVSKSESDLKGRNKVLEERIDVIRQALESVITTDSEESFETFCLRIKDSLDSLWEVILEDWGSKIDELVKLAFRAINTLNIMFGSMRQNPKDQNKDSLLRLLQHATSQNPPLFASEQIKEIKHMIVSLGSGAALPPFEDTDKQTKIENIEKAKPTMDFTKLETTSFRSRGMLLPLLDLHKAHDEDSLPSPTRDAPSIVPAGNALGPAPLATSGTQDVVTPYSETDAIKAISNYQQKFGHTSFHMSDLPSPTPSEDGDNGIGETGTEVSSSNTPTLPQSNVSSSCAMDIISTQAVSNIANTVPVPVKPPVKNRDPRLRVANKDTVALRVSNVDSANKKQKPTSEPVSNGPILKKQKIGPTDIESVVNSSSTVSSIVNVLSNGFDHVRGTGTSNTFPLDSILKDIATNPALWVNLIRQEQQMSVDTIKNFMHLSNSSSLTGTISPMNVTLPKPSVVVHKPAEILPMTPQTASMDEAEKVRMKPRDPRRALQSIKVQKVGNGGTNQIKTSTPISSSQETRVVLNSCNQFDRNVPPIKNILVPDITREFTNNLKNIADIVSVSQAQDVLKPVNDQSISSSEEVSASLSHSQNSWGEVDHLYEGLDEKQKAAFHNERTRRIDEQRKMFSARKLCLVLDLDHTLLNSAKFMEVDPVHDEILRKKEEQDREKAHRHLFRFPHMGMWTKLRPGIWNFLEKASKLFELHLYTMGNKLYATEMAKLLDPKGTLFSGRVISRGDDDDDGDISKSKDLEGVLGMESGVVIIDDSIRVWPHNKMNLIVVERYIYFPCSRRQFGLLGPSLLEIDHDERPEAGTLASSLAVIEKIHENFFGHRSLEEADVRNILASEQRKILGGCRIVFSRVFPVGETSPNLHPLWQTAQQFGAVCTNQIDDQVTHVVANSLGTDKVNWALSTGRFVVHPGWVEASALLYRRANEQDFAIKQ